jgi:hypothetical protein
MFFVMYCENFLFLSCALLRRIFSWSSRHCLLTWQNDFKNIYAMNIVIKFVNIYIYIWSVIHLKNSKALSIWNIWYGWDDHTRIYIIRKYSMHYMSIVFHDYVYRYYLWNLFASIFFTSVETNYLDRSNAARVLVANCLSPFFGWELFMYTGTSYDNNNISYIYTEYQ